MGRGYERPRRLTPEQAGHKPTCPFTNNFGPSCDCDGLIDKTPEAALLRKQVIWAMEMSGWESVAGDDEWPMFQRVLGPHRITVSRVHSGWNLVWIRGSGLTILEEGRYGSVTACMSAFFEFVASWKDLTDDVLKENIQYKLKEAKEAKPDGGKPA